MLSEKHWLDDSDDMPHIGCQPDHGYMSTYEWDGDEYVLRRGEGASDMQSETHTCNDENSPSDWRSIFLDCLGQSGSPAGAAEAADSQGRVIIGTDTGGDVILDEVMSEAVAAFSDGVNTGGGVCLFEVLLIHR